MTTRFYVITATAESRGTTVFVLTKRREANINTGREIIHSILNGGDIKVVLDAGLNKSWLEGDNTGASVIFNGIDKQAFKWLLNHYARHRTVPAIETFRQHFPEETMKFSSKVIPLEELTELAEEKVTSFLVADVIGRAIDLHDNGKIMQASSLLGLDRGIRFQKARADDLSSASFDLEAFLNTELEMGIPFGIDSIDEQFYGFQPGMLITLLGRQKSGKSWSTINSALNAWKEGYTVLVFSVEMDVSILRQRVWCLGAHVSPSRMRRGKLFPNEKELVRDFQNNLAEEEGTFLISKKKSGITVGAIREEIKQYNPNIVYIDGFSFMVDEKTGRMTSDWQANENVADALKELAMEEEIVVFVNTQVQEKQYMPKHGIEARTIASGTGLLKASDLVLGQNKDGDEMIINCVYSRFEWPDTVVIDVDWETMNFVSTIAKLEELNV